MTHEDRPYELHDDFLATLTRDNYLKFRHMDSQSFSASSPSHHKPSKLKTSFSGESKHQTPSESQTALNNYKKGPQRKAFFSQQEEIMMMMHMPMQKSNFSLIQNQRHITHIQFISHHFTPRCHKGLSYVDRIPSTNPGAEPPRDARDSGSARSHSTHLETSSSDRP